MPSPAAAGTPCRRRAAYATGATLQGRSNDWRGKKKHLSPISCSSLARRPLFCQNPLGFASAPLHFSDTKLRPFPCLSACQKPKRPIRHRLAVAITSLGPRHRALAPAQNVSRLHQQTNNLSALRPWPPQGGTSFLSIFPNVPAKGQPLTAWSRESTATSVLRALHDKENFWRRLQDSSPCPLFGEKSLSTLAA